MNNQCIYCEGKGRRLDNTEFSRQIKCPKCKGKGKILRKNKRKNK